MVNDFPNVSSLANYIKIVNQDNELYNQFLDHKRGIIGNKKLKNVFGRGNFGLDTDLENPISAFECFVCDHIHIDIQPKTKQHVYDCSKPLPNSGWEYHWSFGDCQSRKLINLVNNHSIDDIKCD